MKKVIIYLIITLIIFNGCDVETSKENKLPTSPILTSPSNKASDIKLDAELKWTESTDQNKDALVYNVYFGTENPPTTKVSASQTSLNFKPTLNSKTTYYWKVTADNQKGVITSSEIWSFTTLDNPNIPTAPVLTSPQDQTTEIPVNTTLTWDASTDVDGDVVKYLVLLSTDNPPDDTLGRELTATTFNPSLNNITLSQSTTYYWKVIAYDGKGGFSESKTISFTTITNTNTNSNPPSIPNLLNPSNGSANIPLNEVLSWNKSIDPEGEIVTYNVLFGTEITPTTSVSSAKSDTFFTPTLASNITYYWKIIATDALGLTSESEIRSFTTIAQNSTKITLNSPPHNSTKIKLTEILKWNEWKPTNSGTFKYTVYLGTESTPTTQVSTEQTGNTFAPSLTASTPYYWKVVATDGSANTSESEVWKFTTASNPPPKPTLTTPVNQATNIALNTSLNWNAVTDGNKTIKYNVYFGTSSQLTKIESTLQTANSFTPTGIKGNTKYYWKIVADNGDGGQTESDIWSFTTLNTPPLMPALITPADLATNVNISESLKWSSSNDPDGDIVNYNVYLGTVNPPTTKVTSAPLLSTSYNPPLNGNTKYYWKVTAEDGKGGVTESDIRSFTTGAVASTIPILITPNNNASNIPLSPVPTLSWNASVGKNGGAVMYNVYFGTTNPPSKVTSTPQTATSYTPTINLLSNASYFWKIEAIIANEGNFSSEIRQFKTEIVPPSKPTLSAPVNNATNISLTPSLSWSASTSSSGYSINYKVYLGTSSNPTTVVSNSQTANTYAPTTALLSNTTYYWKIEANDGNGGVTVSEINNFKTLVPPSVPALTSPANLATEISINTNLTWTASTTPSSNDIKYKVLLDTSSTFTSSVKVESTLQTSTSYTLTNLLSNINYYWKVIAVDGNGLITESDVRKFKSLLVPPSVPTLTAPVNDGIAVSLNPILTWNASTSLSGIAAKYNVYFGTDKTSLTKVISLQPETSYTANSLLKNTKYYWKIEAEDGNGGLSQSVIDSFTIIIFDLVNVEGGTFTMTASSVSKSVTLSSYSIGKYEITQAQWESVMGSNPSSFNTCSDCPVEYVSWDDIQPFLTKLNTKTGKNYRLPTEAEWEYATRGGKKSNGYTYSGSNDIDSVAWYNGNSGSKSHVVGTTKKANELGIYDMNGNVFEWCNDWYDSYVSGSETNPTGPNTGVYRVLRGGSWRNSSGYCTVSYRDGRTPDNRNSNIGFRLVLP